MMQAFSTLSVPQISVLVRRCALTALLFAVIVLAGAIYAGKAQVGLGFCFGVSLALLNLRMITAATIKASARAENSRRPLVGNTAGRLALVSVIALGITWFDHLLGMGTLIGLAVFQFLLLGNAAVSMIRIGQLDSIDSGDED